MKTITKKCLPEQTFKRVDRKSHGRKIPRGKIHQVEKTNKQLRVQQELRNDLHGYDLSTLYKHYCFMLHLNFKL